MKGDMAFPLKFLSLLTYKINDCDHSHDRRIPNDIIEIIELLPEKLVIDPNEWPCYPAEDVIKDFLIGLKISAARAGKLWLIRELDSYALSAEPHSLIQAAGNGAYSAIPYLLNRIEKHEVWFLMEAYTAAAINNYPEILTILTRSTVGKIRIPGNEIICSFQEFVTKTVNHEPDFDIIKVYINNIKNIINDVEGGWRDIISYVIWKRNLNVLKVMKYLLPNVNAFTHPEQMWTAIIAKDLDIINYISSYGGVLTDEQLGYLYNEGFVFPRSIAEYFKLNPKIFDIEEEEKEFIVFL